MPGYFADECVAQLIVDGLVSHRLDVVHARTVCPGDTDERVLSIAAATGRIVITEDWGFGEMTVRSGRPSAGVIILSLHALSASAREAVAVSRIIQLADQAIGHLTIIEPGRVRRRTLTL